MAVLALLAMVSYDYGLLIVFASYGCEFKVNGSQMDIFIIKQSLTYNKISFDALVHMQGVLLINY